MKDIVTIICYGIEKKMEREEAKEFYIDCIRNSEGSEQSRYMNIYLDLLAGLTTCTDE